MLQRSLLVIGIAVLGSAAQADEESLLARTPPDSVQRTNPVSGSRAAVQAGAALYAERCAICHGNDGDGGGAAARGMRPRPIAFGDRNLMNQVDDAQLYWAIHQGSPGTAMAGYSTVMTEEEIWQVVAFLRHFTASEEETEAPSQTTGRTQKAEKSGE